MQEEEVTCRGPIYRAPLPLHTSTRQWGPDLSRPYIPIGPRLLSCLLTLLMILTFSGCGQVPDPVTSQAEAADSPRVVPTPTYSIRPTPLPTSILHINPILPPIEVANPARLLIPTIGVDVPVESVGILSNGDLATPTEHPWNDVGWYNGGPRPGEQGSAVIDGHLDRPGAYPAVFWNLRNIQVGDEVIVVDVHGKTLHFHVTAIMFYSPQHAPLQQIFENTAGRFLNLITCAGDWIPSQHQTTLRLVVFTSLE